MASLLSHVVPRRRFLAGLGVSIASLAALSNLRFDAAAASGPADPTLRGRVWVRQFSVDGPAEQIASRLGESNLGVVVKTHDGVDWMAAFDTAPDAIEGPGDVERLASRFENYAVPFQAWSVVKGIDPAREAQMAAAVLDAGAQSLVVDLESYDGFWTGTPESARRFGNELRSLAPDATIDVAIDPRPWMIPTVPLEEFPRGTTTPSTPEHAFAAYEAPFPDRASKAGPRRFPLSIPIDGQNPDVAREGQRCWDTLLSWHKPVHFIWGTADQVFTEAWGREWAALLPKSTFDVLNAGHFLQETHGQEVAGLLLGRIKQDA